MKFEEIFIEIMSLDPEAGIEEFMLKKVVDFDFQYT